MKSIKRLSDLVAGWLSFLRVGFKTKMTTACIVVLSITFLRLVSTPSLRLALTLVFTFSASLFFCMNLREYISYGLILVTNRNIQWVQLPYEYANLVARMGVHIRKFGYKEGFANAYSNLIKKTVVVGRELVEKLTEKELLAVFAHELAHIKKKHHWKTVLLSIPFILCTLPWRDLPPIIFFISTFAYIFVVMTPINWAKEFEADKVASDFVGKESLRSALSVIGGDRIEEPSETHPSIAKRLEKLEG